ncbi:unnamed protein product [Gongylonema pulchrum]|uniref:Dynein light chain n=1 Tax=Gongylonema pulchrum TaxID=637853 RepID=A0A183EVV9_9BILA|nr:unnamed protein product [Gongylonema pulchrum]
MAEDPQSVDDPEQTAGSQVDNAEIMATGMDAEMQQYAVQCANEAIAQWVFLIKSKFRVQFPQSLTAYTLETAH